MISSRVRSCFAEKPWDSQRALRKVRVLLFPLLPLFVLGDALTTETFLSIGLKEGNPVASRLVPLFGVYMPVVWIPFELAFDGGIAFVLYWAATYFIGRNHVSVGRLALLWCCLVALNPLNAVVLNVVAIGVFR